MKGWIDTYQDGGTINNTTQEGINAIQSLARIGGKSALRKVPFGIGSALGLTQSAVTNTPFNLSDVLGLVPNAPGQIASLMSLYSEKENDNFQKFAENRDRGRQPQVSSKEVYTTTKDNFQTGGNIPGSIGFTYVRTGDTTNNKYNTKVTPSAQNGTDIYGNPMISEISNPNIDRSFYNDRINKIVLGSDYEGWIKDEGLQDKVRAHENYHAKQFNEGRYNYDIAHNTENAQWAKMQKKPQLPSTDKVWFNQYNRKNRELGIDVEHKYKDHPELRFISDDILVDRLIDREQYDNPYSMEGEAQFYEDTGKEFNKLKSGGIIDDDMGQWTHPGKVTRINSNEITMKGVPYPVVGVSEQTKEKKLMLPGKNYNFANTKKVVEFPLNKNNNNWLDQI